jgi:hypothetical protein
MKPYKYSLDRSSKKYICPACNKKTFVLYINNTTGEPLHPTVGKCDREDNCQHHYTPKQYFADNRFSFDTCMVYTPNYPKPSHPPKPSPSFIDTSLMRKSLSGYENNTFVRYLRCVVGDELARVAVGNYFIGTSKYWGGSTVFWQIDLKGNIRTAKIMQYNAGTGKRVKEKTGNGERPLINWVHNVLKLPDFTLHQCFFGEHLLSDTSKTVAIVESEKTAILASCYMPDLIWLSCGQKHGLNDEKCKVLKGRNVILFPDCKAYGDWVKKAKELSVICTVYVSDLIEKYAARREYEDGFDIGDYLVRYSPSEFIKEPLPQGLTAVMVEDNIVNTEINTSFGNEVVASMVAKNSAFSRFMDTFDCEVTHAETYEPQLSRMLTREDMKRLAAELPDNDSWTEDELCKILKIEPQHVNSLAESKEIYFIKISGKFCRNGCTPF